MVIDSNTKIPSVNTTMGILKAHNEMMPTFFDYDKLHQYLSYFLLRASRIKEPLFEQLKYKDSYEITAKTALINYLVKTNNTDGFLRTKTGLSLAKPSIAQAKELGRISKEAALILDSYQTYNMYEKAARTLQGLLIYPVCNILSADKHRMLMCSPPPKWEPQNTGRVAMAGPAIQNFNRIIQDIVTVPYGWLLVHVDSGQIEPRIIYSAFLKDSQIQALIKLYDDAYFGVLHYVSMPYEDIKFGKMDFTKMDITPELKERRNPIKTHNNAVMYGATSNVSGDPVKALLIEKIGKHPLRKRWVAEVEDKIKRGIRVFPTAFGTPIDITNSDKLEDDMSEDDEFHELVKLGINNPIQGTAADLMRVSVSKANFLFSNKAKNSAIIHYVHDAGRFAVHENDYDKIIDDLKDIVAYEVPDWIPIKSDLVIGRDKGLFEDLY